MARLGGSGFVVLVATFALLVLGGGCARQGWPGLSMSKPREPPSRDASQRMRRGLLWLSSPDTADRMRGMEQVIDSAVALAASAERSPDGDRDALSALAIAARCRTATAPQLEAVVEVWNALAHRPQRLPVDTAAAAWLVLIRVAQSGVATPAVFLQVLMRAAALVRELGHGVNLLDAISVYQAVIDNDVATFRVLRRAVELVERAAEWSPNMVAREASRALQTAAQRLLAGGLDAETAVAQALAMRCAAGAVRLHPPNRWALGVLCVEVVRAVTARPRYTECAAGRLRRRGLSAEIVHHIGSYEGAPDEANRLDELLRRCEVITIGRADYAPALWTAACAAHRWVAERAAASFVSLVEADPFSARNMSAEVVSSASRCLARRPIDTPEEAWARTLGILRAASALLRHTPLDRLGPALDGLGDFCERGRRGGDAAAPSATAAAVAAMFAEVCGARDALHRQAARA